MLPKLAFLALKLSKKIKTSCQRRSKYKIISKKCKLKHKEAVVHKSLVLEHSKKVIHLLLKVIKPANQT